VHPLHELTEYAEFYRYDVENRYHKAPRWRTSARRELITAISMGGRAPAPQEVVNWATDLRCDDYIEISLFSGSLRQISDSQSE
jgi:hypothetical protein